MHVWIRRLDPLPDRKQETPMSQLLWRLPQFLHTWVHRWTGWTIVKTQLSAEFDNAGRLIREDATYQWRKWNS
jgi:hypothetical protein